MLSSVLRVWLIRAIGRLKILKNFNCLRNSDKLIGELLVFESWFKSKYMSMRIRVATGNLNELRLFKLVERKTQVLARILRPRHVFLKLNNK